MKRSYNIKCAVNVINVSRAILTHYTTPDLLAIACRPVQRSPNSFRHIITVVIELCPTSYYQSLDSKSNELCFPHEVLVLPELSLQVKNEDYMVPVLRFPRKDDRQVVPDDFNSLKLQSSYKIYTSPNKLSLVQLYSIYHH